MVQFVHNTKGIDDIIVAGDLNSALDEDEIQMFLTRIGVTDVFSYSTGLDDADREPTFIRGGKCIDTLAFSDGLLAHVQGCRLVNFTEIIATDHLGEMKDLYQIYLRCAFLYKI